LVPAITSPDAQASSHSALAAASIPSALQGKGLLERTCFPSTSPGSLGLESLRSQLAVEKVGVFCRVFSSFSLAWKKAAEPQVMQFD